MVIVGKLLDWLETELADAARGEAAHAARAALVRFASAVLTTDEVAALAESKGLVKRPCPNASINTLTDIARPEETPEDKAKLQAEHRARNPWMYPH